METDNIMSCRFCPAGFFQDLKGQIDCVACPSGWRSEKESGDVEDVIPRDGSRRKQCFKCAAGKKF